MNGCFGGWILESVCHRRCSTRVPATISRSVFVVVVILSATSWQTDFGLEEEIGDVLCGATSLIDVQFSAAAGADITPQFFFIRVVWITNGMSFPRQRTRKYPQETRQARTFSIRATTTETSEDVSIKLRMFLSRGGNFLEESLERLLLTELRWKLDLDKDDLEPIRLWQVVKITWKRMIMW